MDLQMPVMDGFESSRLIKKTNPDIIIIALSAAAGENEIKQAAEAGMTRRLVKPIHPERLYQELDFFLSQRISPEKHNKRTSAHNSQQEQHIMPPAEHSPSEPPNRKDKTEQSFADPQTLPVLDTKTGLMYADSDPDFYIILIDTLLNQIKTEYFTIPDMLKKGEFETAKSLCHSLKSIAGTVGALYLSSAAAEINRVLEKNETITENLILLITDALNKSTSSLEKWRQ